MNRCMHYVTCLNLIKVKKLLIINHASTYEVHDLYIFVCFSSYFFCLKKNLFLPAYLTQDAPVVPTRESWMTELPPELQHIGLGARTFKKRSGPEKNDRSIWTDTPADRERKARVSRCSSLHCCIVR